MTLKRTFENVFDCLKGTTRLNWNYHRRFNALNAAKPFEYDYANSQTQYYSIDNRITADAKTRTKVVLEDMDDRPATHANPKEYGKIDFIS